MATFLSYPELRQDPRNHRVPILDVLRDPDDAPVSYLAMPFLRNLDNPDFASIDELLDCAEQLLEVSGLLVIATETHQLQGLLFLHDHGVAHRDCAYQNITIDAEAMFPRGFHPIADNALPEPGHKACSVSLAQPSSPRLLLHRLRDSNALPSRG
ncbi:hypothetical protein FKP32DRAFT_720804 [Trametes sanguinea]|nr:hypothetical protein FKP32DRAFT_720804 [Trametes sanguinea]